jgi:hypothetical protein
MRAFTFVLGLLLAAAVHGAPAGQKVLDPQALDHELQALKEDVLALNRDLQVLREDLLFPANSQLAVYVSLDTEELFQLDSVKLLLNDQVVAAHLYSPRELQALARGGSHQLYIGNLPRGEHQLVAFFTGIGPNGRDYKRAAELQIKKAPGPQTLELKISDLERKLQPRFVIREWN